VLLPPKLRRSNINRLASALFEDIIIEHNRVVQVRPREDLRTFFRLSYEEHLKLSHANWIDFHPSRDTFLDSFPVNAPLTVKTNRRLPASVGP